MRLELGCERVRRQRGVAFDEDHASTVQQRPPDLERRGVEGSTRKVAHPIGRLKLQVVSVPDQTHHGAVRDPNAFWPPSRS